MSEPHLSSIAKHLVYPDGIASTAWPVARQVCEQAGMGFDRWQDDLARLILAQDANGEFVNKVDGVEVSIPRQVGKTYTVGALVFGLAAVIADGMMIWTAHHTRTSDETFLALQNLANRPGLSQYVSKVRAGNGKQALEFTSGSRILFGAREAGFGRGIPGVDLIVFDEAQILSQKALDGMVPTLNTSDLGLAIRIGTPPRPTDPAEAFIEFRRSALKGDMVGGTYVEIGAPDDADLSDRKVWARANPSFPRRTSEAAILRMRRQLGEESFRREGMGIWDSDTVSTAIDRQAWMDAAIDRAGDGPRCWAVKFSADGAAVGLGVAVKQDAKLIVVDGVRQTSTGEGTSWLVDFLTDPDRLANTSQIVVDGKSGSAWLVDQLRSAKVPARVIWTPSVDQVTAAHAGLLAGLRDGTLRHVDNELLDQQATTVTRRKIGTRGGFGWAAPPGSDASLLDAVTLAHWGAATTKRRPGHRGGVTIL
mgnify:FL=1